MAAAVNKDCQQAFSDVVQDYGAEDLARLMGIPLGTLYNKANANESSHHKPTLHDAVLATIITKDKRILRAFAAAVGEACFQLPDMSGVTTDSLLSHVLKIESEGGDFYKILHKSIADGTGVSGSEYKRIEKEAHEWIAAILEALVRAKEMTA